jgi:hypothetical protein
MPTAPSGLGEVNIRTYPGCLECDVVVVLKGREMILQLPNYDHAVKWAMMESKAYGIRANLPNVARS